MDELLAKQMNAGWHERGDEKALRNGLVDGISVNLSFIVRKFQPCPSASAASFLDGEAPDARARTERERTELDTVRDDADRGESFYARRVHGGDRNRSGRKLGGDQASLWQLH